MMKPFVLLLLLSSLILSGCSTIGYYSQSIRGQVSLLWNRKDINELIENSKTSPELRENLIRVQKIRHFASEKLHLPDNKSYQSYVELGRPYVVWNVFAAEEFSVRPKTWCYLIVGCVSYRGYFDKQNALTYAEGLEKQHLDVYVAGIAAYSTLGWFDDPLLSSMIHWKPRSQASLIFHELSHQLIYIPNETDFNEAFATAVERMGTIQWLLTTKPKDVENYLHYLQAQNDFRHLLLSTRDELKKLYILPIDDTEKRVRKQQTLTQLHIKYESVKQSWPASINFDGWFQKPINNARLTSSMTYLQKVPAFLTIFKETNADWEIFFTKVKKLEELDKKERDQLIAEKMEHPISEKELAEMIKRKL